MLDRWLEPDCEEPSCYQCDKHRDTHEKCQMLLSNILKHLYVKGVFDNIEMECLLDELCDRLEVKIILGDMQVQAKDNKAKKERETNVLSGWIELNNKYLKSLTQL